MRLCKKYSVLKNQPTNNCDINYLRILYNRIKRKCIILFNFLSALASRKQNWVIQLLRKDWQLVFDNFSSTGIARSKDVFSQFHRSLTFWHIQFFFSLAEEALSSFKAVTAVVEFNAGDFEILVKNVFRWIWHFWRWEGSSWVQNDWHVSGLNLAFHTLPNDMSFS